MKKPLRISMVVLAMVLIWATLVLTGCGAQQGSSAPSSTSSVSVPTEAPASNGSQQEGIAVHGHWTIEVRNPDGTLADRREFENSFVCNQGAQLMSNVLARVWTPGGWEIKADIMGGGGSVVAHHIFEAVPNVPNLSPSFKTLGEGTNTRWSPNNQFEAGVYLVGTFSAQISGDFCRVMAINYPLDNAGLPYDQFNRPYPDYTGGLVMSLTGTDLASPIHVIQNQLVDVRVYITFS
jgi:hypothetical protein